jgi:hypothetical protein
MQLSLNSSNLNYFSDRLNGALAAPFIVAFLHNDAVASGKVNAQYDPNETLGAPKRAHKETGRKTMMNVAKFSAALASSVVLTAICIAALSGFTYETLVSPHFWVISVSLAGIFGLAMGDGIGEKPGERMPNLPATGLLPA